MREAGRERDSGRTERFLRGVKVGRTECRPWLRLKKSGSIFISLTGRRRSMSYVIMSVRRSINPENKEGRE